MAYYSTKTYGHNIGLSACFRQPHADHSHCRFLHGYSLQFKFTFEADELDNKKSVSFLPLKLAYAITIHKSQGATLDAIEIDLGKDIFQCGQAYTGLSRAKTMKNIRITNLCKGVWKTDPLVLEWLRINKLK